jgi:hypothetical protein
MLQSGDEMAGQGRTVDDEEEEEEKEKEKEKEELKRISALRNF